jgi:hypothetical protein
MKRALLLVPMLALVAGIATTAGGSVAEPRPEALVRSGTLAQASAGDVIVHDGTVPAALARVIAEELAAEVPLPSGGTFDGIRWEQAGGTFSRREIAAMLQYNAACQWLRAWRDGREAAVAHAVLADVSSWSAWRGSETGAALAAVAADVAKGGGESAATMLADCDASQEREQRYAAALGLSPSR